MLQSTNAGVCSISASGSTWQRFVFSIVGSTLSATCNGLPLGSVIDPSGSTLYTGTAGLFHHPIPTVVTNPNVSATAIPAGAHVRYRNVLVTRGCDGPGGGCSTSVPGERCTMGCISGVSTPARSDSLSLTCGTNGSWSAPPLVCIPIVSTTGAYSVPAYSPVGTVVGLPLATPLGFTVNFTLVSSSPASAPFVIGACSGIIQVSQAVLNFVVGPRFYIMNVVAFILETGTSYPVTLNISVTDNPQPPVVQPGTLFIPETASVNSVWPSFNCTAEQAYPLSAAVIVNSNGLFGVSGPFAQSGMPNGGLFNLSVLGPLSWLTKPTHSILVACTNALGMSSRGTLSVRAAFAW